MLACSGGTLSASLGGRQQFRAIQHSGFCRISLPNGGHASDAVPAEAHPIAGPDPADATGETVYKAYSVALISSLVLDVTLFKALVPQLQSPLLTAPAVLRGLTVSPAIKAAWRFWRNWPGSHVRERVQRHEWHDR